MWRIPLSDLNYDHRETAAVQQVLESGWLTMGQLTAEFETQFAAHHQSAHAIAVANCTCALELVYRYLLQDAPVARRAVIVPDITFVATASAVIAAGGVPVLCDTESQTSPFLSASAVEQLLQSRNDIAAVALMHYAGHDAGAEAVAEICRRHSVYLIEDCAHSPGAHTASGRALGTLGAAGCFSFFSNKNLSTGEGGMIITDDPALADWVRLARSHGLSVGTWTRHSTQTSGYDVRFPGYNSRGTEIMAALGLVQLEKLFDGNDRRRELTLLYQDLLNGIKEVKIAPAVIRHISGSACHILPLLCDSPSTRDQIAKALNAAGIQTSHHYPPIHTFSWYADNPVPSSPSLDNAVAFASHQITLPLHPKLSPAHVREVVHTVRQAIS